MTKSEHEAREVLKAARKKIRDLKKKIQNKEIRRKDKALAEAAALLVLQKTRAIWGDGDDDTPSGGGK